MGPSPVRRIDGLAGRMGQTRSAMVSLLVFEALEARNSGNDERPAGAPL